MTKEDILTLEYDLHNLPTAQHKAGLAGLILMIESMKMRRMSSLPQILDCSPKEAKISFTKVSLQALFDDYFDASRVETASKQKWKDAKLKRIEEIEIVLRDGKKKKEKRFIYDVVQPLGKFLQPYFSDGDGVWLKLWRNMLWNTLRGRPTQRNAYMERADNKPSLAGSGEWRNLTVKKNGKQGKTSVQSIGSTVFIGAQAENAEKVPFQDMAKNNFLLYFWPISSLIFAPRRMKLERKQDGMLGVEHEDAGFLIAIPEPSNLKFLIEDMKGLLRSLDSKVAGYRPADALIDVPAEGAIEFIYHLAQAKVAGHEIADSLASVEIYHLEKQGNNIRTHIAEHIPADSELLNDYVKFRDRFSNPIYKNIRITNLLARRHWCDGVEAVFNSYPWEYFIGKEGKTPRNIQFFGNDVRKKFQAIEREIKGGEDMSEQEIDDKLALKVYQLIRGYVNRRSEEKSGKKYEDFKNNKDPKGYVIYPHDYLEAQEKVCSDAFLAIRGRRAQDFIEYFTGSICSVPQWLPEEEYMAVSNALINNWEKVKTFSLLALSACSYYHKPEKKNETKEEEAK